TKYPCKETLKTLANAHVKTLYVYCDEENLKVTSPADKNIKEAGWLYEQPDNDIFHSKITDHFIMVAGIRRLALLLDEKEKGYMQKLDMLLKTEDEEKYLKRWYMGFAFIAALRSEDNDLAVGACIIKGDLEAPYIMGIGYNAVLAGGDHTNLPLHVDKKNLKDYFVVHAEKNAILYRNNPHM